MNTPSWIKMKFNCFFSQETCDGYAYLVGQRKNWKSYSIFIFIQTIGLKLIQHKWKSFYIITYNSGLEEYIMSFRNCDKEKNEMANFE